MGSLRQQEVALINKVAVQTIWSHALKSRGYGIDEDVASVRPMCFSVVLD